MFFRSLRNWGCLKHKHFSHSCRRNLSRIDAMRAVGSFFCSVWHSTEGIISDYRELLTRIFAVLFPRFCKNLIAMNTVIPAGYLFWVIRRWSPVVLNHGQRNFNDTNPLMSSSLVTLFGVVKQFCRFYIWSETECKTPAEYVLKHNPTSPLQPPPHSRTLSVYIVHFVWKVGGGRSERKWRGNSTQV